MENLEPILMGSETKVLNVLSLRRRLQEQGLASRGGGGVELTQRASAPSRVTSAVLDIF